MIHKFYLNGYYIVLDVASGTLLSVDRMTYDILDDYKLADKAAIVAWTRSPNLKQVACFMRKMITIRWSIRTTI